MASQVSENLAFIDGGGDEKFKEMELLKMNNALIMSLMDESQGDESDDDDRLETIIRSLEAEITMEGRENSSSSSLSMEYEVASNVNGEDNQSWNIGQMDGHDYLASPCDFMMEWVDIDVVPSAPFDDRNLCVDRYDGYDNWIV